MRNFLLLTANVIVVTVFAQRIVGGGASQFLPPPISFADCSYLLPGSQVHCWGGTGVADMNGDRKDDIVRFSSDLDTAFIEYQSTPNSIFSEYKMGGLGAVWSFCAADLDHDGRNEMVVSKVTGVTSAYYWNGSSYTEVNITDSAGAPFTYPQGMNVADINGDSYLDVFVCNDTAISRIFQGTNSITNWIWNQSLISLATVPASGNNGNYASIWTDINADGYIDLLITKCRQGSTNPADPTRIDQVFINNGNNTYTQDVTNWTGLRDGAQGWSTASGDIDNDGDMDLFVLNYDVNARLMINNGAGVFTDAFNTSGITPTTTFFGDNTSFHDFDNDGFVDLLVSGSEDFVWKNNGNGTFTRIADPFPDTSGNHVLGYGAGDLNGDGKLDVFATYSSWMWPSSEYDKLWMNTSLNSHHYVFFDLVGGAVPGMSNINGIGAIVKIYGGWGIQVREVRSGEGYGIQNSLAVHFGLGAYTSIDSVVVLWPSGIVDRLFTNGVDQHYVVYEGTSPVSVPSASYHPFRMVLNSNPAFDDVHVQLFNYDSYGLENLTLEIVDVNGRVVYKETSLTSNDITISHDLFAAGLYMVDVSKGNEHLATEKLIVR